MKHLLSLLVALSVIYSIQSFAGNDYNFMCNRQIVLERTGSGAVNKVSDEYVENYFRIRKGEMLFQMMDETNNRAFLEIPISVVKPGLFIIMAGVKGQYQLDIMTNTSKRIDDFQVIKYPHAVNESILTQTGYGAYEKDTVYKDCRTLVSDFYG